MPSSIEQENKQQFAWTMLHQDSQGRSDAIAMEIELADGRRINIWNYNQWSDLQKAVSNKQITIAKIISSNSANALSKIVDEASHTNNTSTKQGVSPLPSLLINNQLASEDSRQSFISNLKRNWYYKSLLAACALLSLSLLGLGIAAIAGIIIGWPLILTLTTTIGSLAFWLAAGFCIAQAAASLGVIIITPNRMVLSAAQSAKSTNIPFAYSYTAEADMPFKQDDLPINNTAAPAISFTSHLLKHNKHKSPPADSDNFTCPQHG